MTYLTSQAESHSFNVNLATKYGIEGAIMLAHFAYWIGQNERQGINHIEGKTWTYQTNEQIAAWFPYWTTKQVRGIIEKLVNSGVLIKSRHNKRAMDRTSWYAIPDKEQCQRKNVNTFAQTGNSIAQTGNSFAQMGRAIPESAPETKKDNVSTMPFSIKNKPFTSRLSHEQKELHDELVKTYGVRTQDACAWMLAKKYTVSQIRQAIAVYRQDLEGAMRDRRCIKSAAAYIRQAINSSRAPRAENSDLNKHHAERMALGNPRIRAHKRYVTVQIGSATETLQYTMSTTEFMRCLEKSARLCEDYV